MPLLFVPQNSAKQSSETKVPAVGVQSVLAWEVLFSLDTSTVMT